jgi:hypothetical protein
MPKNLIESAEIFIKVAQYRLKTNATSPIDAIEDSDISFFANNIRHFARIYNDVIHKNNAIQIIQNFIDINDNNTYKLKTILRYFIEQFFNYADMFEMQENPIVEPEIITRTISCTVYQAFDRNTGIPISQDLEPGNSDGWSDEPHHDVEYVMGMKLDPNNLIQDDVERIQIPDDQLAIIRKALRFYQDSLDPEDPNEDNIHTHFDIFSLIGFMDQKVEITITKDDKKNFADKYDVDFPIFVYNNQNAEGDVRRAE